MKHRVFLFAALFCGWFGGGLALAQDSEPKFSTQLSKTERIVVDNALLDLTTLAPDQAWIVAKVKPDTNSGSALIITEYDEQGKPVPNPNPDVITHDSGVIGSATILSGSPQVPTSYTWEHRTKIEAGPIPLPDSKHPELNGDLIYSLFTTRSGGTAIFRVNEQAEDEATFRPAYLIPDEWAKFAAPALAFARANSALLQVSSARANQPALSALLTDPNPFIGIAAARTLVGAHLLQGQAAQKALAQTTGMRQSALVYLLLTQPEPDKQLPADDRSETAEELDGAVDRVIADDPLLLLFSNAIEGARDASTLQGLAQGLIAVPHALPRQNLFTSRRLRVLLQRIADKGATLQTRDPTQNSAHGFLDSFFKLLGIKPRLPAK